MSGQRRREYGRHIIADPTICHGQLTLRGTRIMVKRVLDMLADGRDWDYISAAYLGKVRQEAISEAIQLACDALTEKTEKRRRAA